MNNMLTNQSNIISIKTDIIVQLRRLTIITIINFLTVS